MQMREWVVACAITGAFLSGACRGTPSAPAVTTPAAAIATSTAVGTPTPSPLTFEQEVERAYLAYWEAYSGAVLDLDASRVEGFAAGEELEGIQREVAQLRASNLAVRIAVTHDLLVVGDGPNAATVIDQVTNRSRYIDPSTRSTDAESGPGERPRSERTSLRAA